MKSTIVRNGFIAAGLINILGVLIFSRFFTNVTLNQADPIVMSNFGLLMITIWGLAYIAVANDYHKVRWISAVFAVEKLIYVLAWIIWLLNNELGAIYSKDLFAGLFYSIYGINDFIFMLFFAWVFFRTKSE